MKLYDYLLNAGRESPAKIGLEFREYKLPYAYIAAEAMKIGAGLVNLGVKPQTSIGCMVPNIPHFLPLHYGTMMAGCVFVPMNVLLRGPEVEYLLRDSNIKILVTYEMFVDAVDDALTRLEDPPQVFVIGEKIGKHRPYSDLMKEDWDFQPVEVDDALPVQRLYTSGTTGKPKGAQITNANIIANLAMTEKVFKVDPEDRTLCVLPLFHVYALNGVMNSSVRHRTTIVLHTRFEPEPAIMSLANDNITTFAAVPTMYFQILKHPLFKEVKFPRLRHCISGGAPMPVEVLTQWEKETGVPIYEGYGLTETTVSVSINRPEMKKVGSIGKPYPGVEMRVFDENDEEVPTGKVGEICIKSPNVMLGYLNKPEATEEAMKNGYFHTGDLGYCDEDGFYYIVDRKKDMIIKGGFNIYPREIEEVIYALPQVAEAAVIGVFDEEKGERVRACIALKPGQELTEDQVKAHMSANLAKYKLPNDYVFLPELPKGPTGKILKRELRTKWDQWNKDRIKEPSAQAAVEEV